MGSRPEHPEETERTLAAIDVALGERTAADTRAVGRGLPIERAIALAIGVEALVSPATSRPAAVLSLSSSMPTREVVLTRRERDVLGLLAEGRSDREIAEALFLSHRTVSTHVSNILGKLEVATRSAAATYAVRAGLV